VLPVISLSVFKISLSVFFLDSSISAFQIIFSIFVFSFSSWLWHFSFATFSWSRNSTIPVIYSFSFILFFSWRFQIVSSFSFWFVDPAQLFQLATKFSTVDFGFLQVFTLPHVWLIPFPILFKYPTFSDHDILQFHFLFGIASIRILHFFLKFPDQLFKHLPSVFFANLDSCEADPIGSCRKARAVPDSKQLCEWLVQSSSAGMTGVPINCKGYERVLWGMNSHWYSLPILNTDIHRDSNWIHDTKHEVWSNIYMFLSIALMIIDV
jgi:hypothetical protein